MTTSSQVLDLDPVGAVDGGIVIQQANVILIILTSWWYYANILHYIPKFGK
jgi:hypothetical protein